MVEFFDFIGREYGGNNYLAIGTCVMWPVSNQNDAHDPFDNFHEDRQAGKDLFISSSSLKVAGTLTTGDGSAARRYHRDCKTNSAANGK
jgi:hypothetical protein